MWVFILTEWRWNGITSCLAQIMLQVSMWELLGAQKYLDIHDCFKRRLSCGSGREATLRNRPGDEISQQRLTHCSGVKTCTLLSQLL